MKIIYENVDTTLLLILIDHKTLYLIIKYEMNALQSILIHYRSGFV